MSAKKDHWENIYLKKEDNSVSWYQQHPTPSLELILEFNRDRAAAIIDIGAGSSRLADALALGRFSDITLLDISGAALTNIRKRLSDYSDKIDYIISDVVHWNPSRRWQIWHDRAVLHFLINQSEQDAYIDVLVRATMPGSIVVLGTFALDGPEKCSGLPVQGYSAESLKTRLGGGFDLLKTISHTHLTPAQTEQKFTFAVFRRQ